MDNLILMKILYQVIPRKEEPTNGRNQSFPLSIRTINLQLMFILIDILSIKHTIPSYHKIRCACFLARLNIFIQAYIVINCRSIYVTNHI